ncbi:MAG: molybdopterin-synthase adenylyltransferase MoeB [Candidatus Margulisiibacteriota bacterium]
MRLTDAEIERYARHLILPEVGPGGQKKLKAGSVLLVGAGGLGSPMALYLAAAGVGHIGIVDFDVVDASNLQRQILHGTSTLGISKLESAKARLTDLNPHIRISLFETRLTAENALDILEPFDVVADGTDNFATRYLVNDACVLLGKPNVYGSIFRFEGQLSVFHYQGGPCYRCLYPEAPPAGLVPSCAEGGVLGVLPGVIGVMQATEVIKILAGIGEVASSRLVLYDALKMKFREMKLQRDPYCALCSDHPTITSLQEDAVFCMTPSRGPEADAEIPHISVSDLKDWLAHRPEMVLIDVRQPEEYDECRIAGSILIPLGELAGKISSLDPQRRYVMQCRSGGRSFRAAQLLKAAGFAEVYNLTGGILAWNAQIPENKTS